MSRDKCLGNNEFTCSQWGWVGTAQWERPAEVVVKHASKCRTVLQETRVSKL